MRYPDYREATNAAYQLLAKNPTFSLSTNVFYFAEHYIKNTILLTYGQACFLYGVTLDLLMAVSEFGFTIANGPKRAILYNENCPLGCIRFTIAHEIGHAVLGHTVEHDSSSEKEANCFARNFLCPIPVVLALRCNTIEEYVISFDVTERMAEVSLDKQNTDRYYIRSDLFNTLSDMFVAYILGYESADAYMRACVS